MIFFLKENMWQKVKNPNESYTTVLRLFLTWFEPGPCHDSCPPQVLWPDCSVIETCPPEIASLFQSPNIFSFWDINKLFLTIIYFMQVLYFSIPLLCVKLWKHINASAYVVKISYISKKNKIEISKSAKGAFSRFKMEINSLHLIRNIQYLKKH